MIKISPKFSSLALILAAGVIFAGCSLQNTPTGSYQTNQEQIQSVPTTTSVSTNKKITPTPTGKQVAKSVPVFLKVSSPVSGTTISASSVVVRGQTTPGAEVSINDQDIKADANGNFTLSIALDEGENEIYVLANDSDGNVASQTLTVIYETQ